MPKSQYLYISSKNRHSSDKKYNFRVNLNNPIVCNSNEGINVSVIGFSMLNTDYNCKGLTFSFQEIHFALDALRCLNCHADYSFHTATLDLR